MLGSGHKANPTKVEDFGDRDLLQHIGLARILIGEAIRLRRDARQPDDGVEKGCLSGP
jgi:hypothetical protein